MYGAALLLLVAAGVSPAMADTNAHTPPELAKAVHSALAAWSRLVPGDIDGLRTSFASDGPQWHQLAMESISGQGDGPNLAALDLQLRRREGPTATVWARVEATQPGHVSETFGWDFDLSLQEGRWLVWTVVAADRPTDSETVARALPTTTPTTSQRAPTSAPTERRLEVPSDAPKAAGTRIPALSAWIVVVTVVGVAVAGYVAPRLDGRRQ